LEDDPPENPDASLEGRAIAFVATLESSSSDSLVNCIEDSPVGLGDEDRRFGNSGFGAD